jgi:large conductance mechanosensitive channel
LLCCARRRAGHGPARGQLVDFGAFIAAIIYFVIFMAVVYFLIVVPYRVYEARRGNTVFGPAAPMQTCSECLSSDLPAAATRCKYCTSELTPAPAVPDRGAGAPEGVSRPARSAGSGSR